MARVYIKKDEKSSRYLAALFPINCQGFRCGVYAPLKMIDGYR